MMFFVLDVHRSGVIIMNFLLMQIEKFMTFENENFLMQTKF